MNYPAASCEEIFFIIEKQINNQHPDVVIRLEDATSQMKDLSHRAYLRINGLQQIQYGYQAAKLKKEQLTFLISA